MAPSGASCPAFDGIYWNQGESSYRYASDTERTLSVRLLRFTPRDKTGRVHLRLAAGSQLEVTVLDTTNTVLYSAVLRGGRDNGEEQFTCSDGVLWLAASVQVKQDGTGVGRNRKQFGLALATDGALMGVERNTGAALIAWVVPLVQSQDIWFRWPYAPSSGQR